MLILERRGRSAAWRDGEEVALVRSIGTADFAEHLFAYFSRHVPIDSVILFTSSAGSTEAQALATRRSRNKLDRTALRYATRFAHLDPNIPLIAQPNHARLVTRSRLSDIRDESYRSVCWLQTGVVDRCSFLAGAGDEWWSLNLYREKMTGCFSDGETAKLEEIGALAATAAERHLAMSRMRSLDGLWRRLEQSLDRCAVLSSRERQVCRSIVRGLATERIAAELQIGQASVITFRRRAYAKLGVRTRQELLEACSRMSASDRLDVA